MKNNHRTVMQLRKRIHWYFIVAALAMVTAMIYHHFVKNFRIESRIYIEQASTNPILSSTGDFQSNYRQRFQSSYTEKLIRTLNTDEFFISLAAAMEPHQERIHKRQKTGDNKEAFSLKGILSHSTQIYEIDSQTIAIIMYSQDSSILPWLSKIVTQHAITYATEMQLNESNQAITYLTNEITKTTKSTQETLKAIVNLRTAKDKTNQTLVSTMATRDLFYKTSRELEEASFANLTVDAEILEIKRQLTAFADPNNTTASNSSIFKEKILERIENRKIANLSNSPTPDDTDGSTINLSAIADFEISPEFLLQLLQEKKAEKLNLEQKHNFLNERTKTLEKITPLSESFHLQHEYLRRNYLSKLERLRFLKKNITNLELKKISIRNKIKPVSSKNGNSVFHQPSRKKLVVFAFLLSLSAVFISFVCLDYAFPKILLKEDLIKHGSQHTFTLPTVKTVGDRNFSWIKSLQTMRAKNSQLIFDSSGKQIINQLDFIATKQQIKTPITCTQSYSSNEGKTHTASMIADISANQGDKVALIDADWYKQALSKSFSQKVSEVKKNITLIDRDFFQDSPDTSKQYFDNISTLLGDEQFLTHFDKIVIDMPPYFAAPESLEVMQTADFILLVCKSGYTNLSHFFDLRERIENLIHNPQTTYFSVINNVTELNSSRSYTGYANYGYSRYQTDTTKQPNKQPIKNRKIRKAV
jgi:Mrp family chromosome partitioning ATPase